MPITYLKRGLVYQRRGESERAARDFGEAIRLNPGRADAHFARGILRLNAKDYAGAAADFDNAERLGQGGARLHLLRAEARARLGDKGGAGRDRAAGLAVAPVSELDHATRGYALLGADPQAALAEFEAALALNPQSLVGLQNKAHALAGPLGRPAEAVAALDRAVELYPDFTPARAGRAVLLARAGKRAEAHRDAAECLRRDTAPATLYQLAGVYALTSRSHPGDGREALRLLSAAFTAGFSDFATADADPDLDPIRADPRFRAAIREFRERAERKD